MQPPRASHGQRQRQGTGIKGTTPMYYGLTVFSVGHGVPVAWELGPGSLALEVSEQRRERTEVGLGDWEQSLTLKKVNSLTI